MTFPETKFNELTTAERPEAGPRDSKDTANLNLIDIKTMKKMEERD